MFKKMLHHKRRLIGLGLILGLITLVTVLSFNTFASASHAPKKVDPETIEPLRNIPDVKWHSEVIHARINQELEAKAQAEAKRIADEKAAAEAQAQDTAAAQAASQAQQVQVAQTQAPAVASVAQGGRTYYINSQYMALASDQAFIDSNPSIFAENTITGTDYFAGHEYSAGNFIKGLRVGDLIVVNGSRTFRVDVIRIIVNNSDEAFNILGNGQSQAIIQTCVDNYGNIYFDTLTQI